MSSLLCNIKGLQFFVLEPGCVCIVKRKLSVIMYIIIISEFQYYYVWILKLRHARYGIVTPYGDKDFGQYRLM